MSKEQVAPGAPAAAGTIPLAVPHLDGREWELVREALDTNWVSSVGPFVDRFEEETAAYVGSRNAVAVASGTAALHVALLLAGVEAGDEVIMPSLTFVAPAFAVRYLGADPVFVDAEPRHWQLDVAKVEEFLRRECRREADGTVVDIATGRPVRAILPVHVLGHPVDLEPLVALAEEFGLVVVEDAAEALGASYDGRAPGTFGRFGCLSFNGNKIATTGGGGMLLTDDDALADRARYLTTQAKDDPVEYVHGAVGFNYRLSNVLAAIGCAQIESIEKRVASKRSIAGRYEQAFAGVPGLTSPRESPRVRSTFWLWTLLVDERVTGIDSRELLRRLGEDGIQSRPLWQPLHLSRPFADARSYRCETAERLSRQALSLPSSVGLIGDDQERVIASVLRHVGGGSS